MSEDSASGGSRRRTTTALAVALGAAGSAAWVLQHRAVRRAEAAAGASVADEGLAFPGDLTHHFVDVPDGGRLHVMERGEGPPLVLLHGLMLSSALWVHQLRDLADRHRVVTIDLSGHGQSILGKYRYTADGRDLASPAMHRLAADVWAVLEALDIRDALLVGHSMGGMTALQLALDVPRLALARRVAGLTLVSTTAGPFSNLPGWSTLSRLGGAASSRAVRAGARHGARALPSRDLRWWVSRLGFGADAAPAQVRFVERMHVSNSPRAFGELLPSLAAFDLSGRLQEIELPTVVVVGTHDRVIGPAHARRLAADLPHAELIELPRCGHQPMLERRNEFSRIIDEFSAKLG